MQYIFFNVKLLKNCTLYQIIPPPDKSISVKIGYASSVYLNDYQTVKPDCKTIISSRCLSEQGISSLTCPSTIYSYTGGGWEFRIFTNNLSILGQVHKVRLFADLNGVTDALGMGLTVTFTADISADICKICQNAYIYSYPVPSANYDISYGSERRVLFTYLKWDSSDLQCPPIVYEVRDYNSQNNVFDASVFSFDTSINELSIQTD